MENEITAHRAGQGHRASDRRGRRSRRRRPPRQDRVSQPLRRDGRLAQALELRRRLRRRGHGLRGASRGRPVRADLLGHPRPRARQARRANPDPGAADRRRGARRCLVDGDSLIARRRVASRGIREVDRGHVPDAARAARCGRESAPTSPSHASCASATRRWDVEARGVTDETVGFHPHHTVWSWSAGVGATRDGRSRRLEPRRGHQRPGARLRARGVDATASPRSRGRPPSTASRRSRSTTARASPSRPRRSAAATNRASASATATASRSASFSGTLPGGVELAERARGDGAPRRRLVTAPAHPGYLVGTRPRHGGSSPDRKT